MSFTAKQIKGGVVEKRSSDNEQVYKDADLNEYWGTYRKGYNKGIDAQSSVPFRLNREKLEQLIGDNICGDLANGCIKDAVDAICAADKEIVERAE